MYINFIKLPFKSQKAGGLLKHLGFARNHSIVTRSSVSLSSATTPQTSCFSKFHRFLLYIEKLTKSKFWKFLGCKKLKV